MSQHFEALEADFQREYQINLRDALWGERKLGLRRLMVLIRGLPPHSAVVRSTTNGQEWTNVEELLATIAEVIDVSNQMYYQSNTKKHARSWKPLKISRPGREVRTTPTRRPAPRVPKNPDVSSPGVLSRFFGTHGRVVVDGL